MASIFTPSSSTYTSSGTGTAAPKLARVGVYQSNPYTGGGVSPVSSAPDIGPAPIASAPQSIGDAYSNFSNVFAPNTIDPNKVAADIQALFGTKQPQITAPTIQPAKINFAQGQALQENIYSSQFNPVQRELQRQANLADQAVAGQTAQSGLEASGAGLALRRRAQREFEQREEDASRDISASATATRIQTELAVATRNAEFEQQASLAEAGFDLEAQKISASNLLAGETAAAQGYITALGISANQAESYRTAFMNYLSEGERNSIARDTAAFDRYATLFNLMLQQKKLDSDITLAQDAQSLAERELRENVRLEEDRLGLANRELTQQAAQANAAQRAQDRELQANTYNIFRGTPAGTALAKNILQDYGLRVDLPRENFQQNVGAVAGLPGGIF